jgi:hypothetical protein
MQAVPEIYKVDPSLDRAEEHNDEYTFLIQITPHDCTGAHRCSAAAPAPSEENKTVGNMTKYDHVASKKDRL